MSITFKEVEHTYSPNTPFAYYALKGIDLNIKDGSMTALIGHTGSGKSTLIQHINALLLPTKGKINIEDFIIDASSKPTNLKDLRRKAGLVFQFPEYQLFEETILKDISFGPKNFGVSQEEIDWLAMITQQVEKKIEDKKKDLDDQVAVLEQQKKQIAILDQDVRNSQIPADEINRDIAFIMGRAELVFENTAQGYRITRKGKRAKNLSKGEENAIALSNGIFIIYLIL
mgnify:CR=1 FL=1